MRRRPTAPPGSDTELIAAAQAGDTGAFAELWRRHYRSALRVAHQFTSSIDADDLVSEAYVRIYQRVLAGGGPTGAFRPYLYTTIRNLASTWGAADRDVNVDVIEDFEDERIPDDPATFSLDRTLTARAFRSLPDRWQTVLWYTEIEGMDPHEVAPLIGLTPNGVAALAYRAREGLRAAWLQAHVSEAGTSPDCSWAMSHLGGHARNSLSDRDTTKLTTHLAACAKCSIISEEVEEVGSHLAMVMLPILLGSVAGGALLSQLAAPSSAVAAQLIPALPHAVEAVAHGFGAAAGGGVLVGAGAGAGAGVGVGAGTGIVAAPVIGGGLAAAGAATGIGAIVGTAALVAVIGGSVAIGAAAAPADQSPVVAVSAGPSGGQSGAGDSTDSTSGATDASGPDPSAIPGSPGSTPTSSLGVVVDGTTSALGGVVGGTTSAVGGVVGGATSAVGGTVNGVVGGVVAPVVGGVTGGVVAPVVGGVVGAVTPTTAPSGQAAPPAAPVSTTIAMDFSGRGAPGATVAAQVAGAVWATTTVSPSGTWSIHLDAVPKSTPAVKLVQNTTGLGGLLGGLLAPLTLNTGPLGIVVTLFG